MTTLTLNMPHDLLMEAADFAIKELLAAQS